MSTLKPVGVFWDIENCCVPKGKSALKIIERIRERFFFDCREAEFICVCDINKESETTIKDLNDGQINVVHINATAKNAADDKIRQSLRRFSDSHQIGTKVILISSDVNFASDLSDLRHRKKFHVVLIHKAQVSDALITCANESYSYEDLVKDLPDRPGLKEVTDHLLVVFGYCKDVHLDKVRQLLKMISNNCGGKVTSIGPLFAILKFDTLELMDRAKKRMNGEDVYGRKITVCLPEETPFFNTVRKLSVNNINKRNESPSPQRRPARNRTNSRSYTPELDVAGGITGANPHYNQAHNNHYYIDQYYAKQGSNADPSVPGVEGYSLDYFTTPGGPLPNFQGEQHGITAASGQQQGNSPGNNVLALPNSNSDRFYSKSSVSDISKDMENTSIAPPMSMPISTNNSTTGHTYEISDLRQAGQTGKSIVVFKPSVKSLKDIPTPSFGFRDMPPPSLPNMPSSKNIIGLGSDPIKLIESSSTVNYMYGQSGNPAAPNLSSSLFEDQKQVAADKGLTDFNFKFSGYQPSVHNKIPPRESPNLQQRMSSPVMCRARSSCSSELSEDQIGVAHSYPANTCNSEKQMSQPFKRPSTPKKGRHQSPNRIYTNSTKANAGNFQPRSSSVSPSFYNPNTSNHRATSPFTSLSVDRPRPKQPGCHLYRVPTPDSIGDPEMDYQSPNFNPSRDQYVELIVSNLDYNIHPREWRKILYATFQPHVKVLSIEIRVQADNTSMATIRLPTEQDARFAISQFHRRKIGYKRISVQFKSDGSHSPADSLRTDTISLLMEAKDQKLALSRIIDLFDKRFHKAVSVSDIYKMRDIVQIQEISGAGRWVKLQPGVKKSPTPVQGLEMENPELLEQPVCPIHCHEGTHFYTEALNACMLPNVIIMRKHFSPQLHSLLLSHNGYVPLMSFPACYAAEFYPLKSVKEGGIPLEHVIACVPGVEITVSKAGVKVIQFQENREQFYDMMKGTSWQELGKISREVMDLLRQQSSCSMPVSKFIPSYHHYFGRQCRVADYGYTKLQELFEAIPHAIQVLGTGDRKVITLSPRAQLKRFTTDIIKVVKAQPAKQILLQEFAYCFEKVMGLPLHLPHYGVSYIEDVLGDIPTTTLIVIEEGKHTLLAVPRRDQTPEEVERTKQFALEVVDLLKHHPQCRMAFNKFIPAYHHHFGRQCRVAAYGFNKLTDLFEAISHVVEMEDEGEERLLHLTAPELRKVLCEQLSTLIRPVGSIPVNKLLSEFGKHFGFGLKLEDFGVETVHALVQKMRSHLKLEERNGQEYLCLVEEVYIPLLGLQVMQLLMDESGGSLPLMELCMRYESLFAAPCDVKRIREELLDFVQIDDTDGESGGNIRLTSHQVLGRNLRLLLLHHQQIPMCDLTTVYRQQFGVEVSPALYGFQTLYQLLHSFPHILQVKGKPTQKYLVPSGMLPTPGILPPARVDVTSPNSFVSPSTSNSVVQSNKSATDQSMSTVPSYTSQTSTTLSSSSQLLQHASQLWDPSLVHQSPAPSYPAACSASFTNSSTRILDQINKGTSLSASSPKKLMEVSNASKVLLSNGTGGNTWQGVGHMGSSVDPISSSNSSKIENPESTNQPAKVTLPQSSNFDLILASSSQVSSKAPKINDSKEDIFPSGEPPLDTSSTHSQLNSSSQSSTGSPIKRRPRIAANFSQPQ